MAVPLDHYLVMNPPPGLPLLQPTSFHVISDASYFGLAAAVVCPETGDVLAWSAVELSYDDLSRSRFQPQREYLGLLLGACLVRDLVQPPTGATGPIPPVTFRWTTDCTGAEAWALKHKCSSAASFFANAAVTWLQLFCGLFLAESMWIPGTRMQDIDRLSRRREQVGPHSAYAPSIPLEKERHLPLGGLLRLCDPYLNRASVNDYKGAFLELHSVMSQLFPLPQCNMGPPPLSTD
jgi:hypothetical protein